MRTWIAFASLVLIAGCQKELGELCAEDKECGSGECAVIGYPGASGKGMCVTSPPCGGDGVEYIGLCLRACTVTADCPEGSACDGPVGGCFPACERDDQCGNNTCSRPGEVCD
ncbi:MAG: hypothetical protein IPK80_11245 [Nannocystis sp.]|nr:hypothetical protein [Nannocystis sp.]